MVQILSYAEFWNVPIASFRILWDNAVLNSRDLGDICHRVQIFDPPTRCFLQLGKRGMATFKRLASGTYLSGPLARGTLATESTSLRDAAVFEWRQSLIPEFNALTRVYVEYDAVDHQQVRLSLASVVRQTNQVQYPTRTQPPSVLLLQPDINPSITAYSDTKDLRRRRNKHG